MSSKQTPTPTTTTPQTGAEQTGQQQLTTQPQTGVAPQNASDGAPDPRLLSLSVPRTPQDAEAAGRALCPALVAKYESKEKTADPDFLPMLAKLEALEPGSGDPQGEAIFREFMALAKKKNEASGSTESAELRTMYDDHFTPMMAEWQAALEAQGVPLEERSQLAAMHRTTLRELTRKLMSDTVAVAVLRARDLVKYGQETGPTFDQLFEKEKAAPGVSDAQAHQNIIGSSQRHNQMVSDAAKGTSPKPPGGGGT